MLRPGCCVSGTGVELLILLALAAEDDGAAACNKGTPTWEEGALAADERSGAEGEDALVCDDEGAPTWERGAPASDEGMLVRDDKGATASDDGALIWGDEGVAAED